MKRISVIVLLVCLSGFCCRAAYTSVKGWVKMDKIPEQVILYQVIDGDLKAYSTTQVAENGAYGFLFEVLQPGFYTVGTKDINFPVYVKGDEEVNLDLYDQEAKLNGKNTKENKVLYQWEAFSQNIRIKSAYFWLSQSTYKDFFPDFEKFVKELPAFRKQLHSGNKVFDELLAKMIDYERDYYAIIFLHTPRTEHPEKSDWPDYYQTILSDSKYVNDEVLQFPLGMRMLSCYAAFAHQMSGKPYTNPDEYNEICIMALKNDRLKGEYVLMNAFSRYKSYDQYLKGMQQYERYLVTPSLKARAEVIGTKLYDTRSGGIAADFTYPDVNGKEISLSDFKGKVVLVDVWATWCGPCRGEIPHLKKLEEEMKGTDVVFIGVSVDEAKNKQKWLDFIKKEELGGVQLLASGWSKITKDYKINGIPRFMVFDRKGNIVSVDAPRPSSPELKQMLEAELKK